MPACLFETQTYYYFPNEQFEIVRTIASFGLSRIIKKYMDNRKALNFLDTND